ncbi:MAG: aldo/keto reductase [Ruminococcus sp.]
MENHYNLLYREDERELIPICKQMGVSLMPYSPLAAGHLARSTWNGDTCRSKTDRVAMGKYDRTEEQDMKIVARVAELAECYGVKMQQIALAWHWAKGVASPIVGATKSAYLTMLPAHCSPVDRRGRGIPGRTICAAPNRRCDRPQPGRGRYAAG